MRAFSTTMPIRESRVVLWVRRVLVAVVLVHVVISIWSTYRRLWQVQRIQLRVTSTVLTPGTTVGYDVITSGEVRNRILLELVQGEQREVLVERHGRLGTISAYDVRLFRDTAAVAITPGLLAKLHPGAATLRLTVFGAQKLLRTPAPRVREVEVHLRDR